MPKSDLTIIQLGAANEPFPINSRTRVSQPLKFRGESSIKIVLVKREENQLSRIDSTVHRRSWESRGNLSDPQTGDTTAAAESAAPYNRPR